MFTKNNSIWITSLPGCHVRIENQFFIVPVASDGIQTELSLVNSVGGVKRLEYNFHVQVLNGTYLGRKG